METLSDPRITAGLSLAVVLAAAAPWVRQTAVRPLSVSRVAGPAAPARAGSADPSRLPRDDLGELAALVERLETGPSGSSPVGSEAWAAVRNQLASLRTMSSPEARLDLLELCLRIAVLSGREDTGRVPPSAPLSWPLDLRAVLQAYQRDVAPGPRPRLDPSIRRAQLRGIERLEGGLPPSSRARALLDRVRRAATGAPASGGP